MLGVGKMFQRVWQKLCSQEWAYNEKLYWKTWEKGILPQCILFILNVNVHLHQLEMMFLSSVSDVARTTTGNLLLSYLQSLYLAGKETGKLCPFHVVISNKSCQMCTRLFPPPQTLSWQSSAALLPEFCFVSSFAGWGPDHSGERSLSDCSVQ